MRRQAWFGLGRLGHIGRTLVGALGGGRHLDRDVAANQKQGARGGDQQLVERIPSMQEEKPVHGPTVSHAHPISVGHVAYAEWRLKQLVVLGDGQVLATQQSLRDAERLKQRARRWCVGCDVARDADQRTARRAWLALA